MRQQRVQQVQVHLIIGTHDIKCQLIDNDSGADCPVKVFGDVAWLFTPPGVQSLYLLAISQQRAILRDVQRLNPVVQSLKVSNES